MASSMRETANIIKEELENDPTLASYVKSFKAGDLRISRMIYPYVSVANISLGIAPHDTARDIHTYSIQIMAGTRSLVPGRAFEGSEQSGARGIVQLCEDIVAVVRDNTFGGIFFAPPANITCKLYENKNSGGIAWNAGVAFAAFKFVSR